MEDFYQLFAIFNSLDENPLDTGAATNPPTIWLPSSEQKAQQERLRQGIARLRQTIAQEAATTAPRLFHRARLVAHATDVQPAARACRGSRRRTRNWRVRCRSSLVAHELKKPRPAFVLVRGNYDQRGAAVQRHPRVPAAAATRVADRPPRLCALAGPPRASAYRPRGRQPFLATDLRHGARQDGRRLRCPGRAAQSPRPARLACRRVPRKWLERPAASQTDRDLGDVPASVASEPQPIGPATRPTVCFRAARGSGSMPK